jgi:uncharacterized protein (DUF4415 family)
MRNLKPRFAADPDEAHDADWTRTVVGIPERKQDIHIRLDADVLFRGTGKGYQTRINNGLRAFCSTAASIGPALDNLSYKTFNGLDFADVPYLCTQLFRKVNTTMRNPSAMGIANAIARLPQQSNASVSQVLVNARRLNSDSLVQACQDELQVRGSLNLNEADAKRAAGISAKTAGRTLSEIIEIAFKEVPAKPEELLILRWIAQHPGTSYATILNAYGKNDLSLVIGHLIYYRFGYFRPLLNGPIQSDLLLDRDNSSGKVCYTLRPEALEALSTVGILGV